VVQLTTNVKPVGMRDTLAPRSLKDPLRLALSAAPNGLREPLLLALVSPYPMDNAPLGSYAAATSAEEDTPVRKKMRSALRRIGAVRDDDYRWRLP
jgi:hypothetical protein